MKRKGDITGKIFDRLTVTGFSHQTKYNKFWNCDCICGNEVKVLQQYLFNGSKRSCNCLQKERRLLGNVIHGMRHTHFYGIWKGMNGRCYTKANRAYRTYGKIGIKSVWKDSFLSFKKDMYRSYIAHVKKHGESRTSIDRIDGTKGYSKENCRWATPTLQAKNRKVTVFIKIGDIEKTILEWAEHEQIPVTTLRDRYMRGVVGKDFIRPKMGYPRLRKGTSFQTT